MDINKFFTRVITGDVRGAVKSLSSGEADDEGEGIHTIISPSQRWTPDNTPWEYDSRSGNHEYFKWEGCAASAGRAYQICPPMQAIINRKGQAFINGKTWLLNDNDKVSQSSAALKVRNLFRTPNPVQTQSQFELQLYTYVQTFGYSYVLFRKPSGFKSNIDAFNMWNIPPSMIDVEETEKLFYQTDLKGIIKTLTLKYKDLTTTVNVDDIYIFKDSTPSFSNLIFPESRVSANTQAINNIVGAMESRGLFINERGALGILTQPASKDGLVTMPMPDPEKQELQRQMRKYGTRVGQNKFIITKTALDWKQIGAPMRDLLLFEEVEADVMMLCDSWNYPYRLLANPGSNSLGGTDANVFLKSLYQNTTIPESQNIGEQWGQAFGLVGIRVDKDYSHVPCLQEDEGAKATARATRTNAYKIAFELGANTLNDLRVANGEDPLPDKQFNMYYDEYQKWKSTNYPQPAADGGQGQQGEGGQSSLIAV